MRPKRYTLLIADRTTGSMRRFTVSLRPFVAGACVLISLPVLMGLGARWSVHAELEELRSSNNLLQTQNASYRAATSELTAQISSLQAAVNELGDRAHIDPATLAAVEKLSGLSRNRAVGGAATPVASAALSSAFSSPDATFGVIRDLLNALESGLNSARSGIERRRALAAATPSIWPVTGWLSSSFGRRRDPFNGIFAFHDGIDIVAGRGEPVLATADGLVASSGYAGDYGNRVVITHAFGLETRYGHLSKSAVQPGQNVRRGDVIGYIGSTGRSTSPHLHYEVWLNSRLVNPLRLLSTR
ncbi:MAG TPA: M23 family metallopeptidase [Vicinamibacterales bacterium]|nr:M23 family metallopeptidase [Vicinamibacterales bacterium]